MFSSCQRLEAKQLLSAPMSIGSDIIKNCLNKIYLFFSCQQIIRITWASITMITYLSVIILFFVTAYYVKRSNRSSVGNQRRSHSLRRLFLSVMIFAIFNSFEAPGGYVFLSILPTIYAKTNITSTVAPSPCDNYDEWQLYASERNERMHQLFTVSIVMALWDLLKFGRMCADPFVCIVFDANLRKLTMEVLRRIGQLFVWRSLKVV